MEQKNIKMTDTIRIAICEEDTHLLEMYYNQIQYVSEKHALNITIEKFSNSNALVLDILYNKTQECEAIILNTMIGSDSGFEIAKELRSYGYTGEFLYVSDTAQGVQDALDIGAFHYLVYPRLSLNRVEEAVLECSKKIHKNRLDILNFNGKQGKSRIKYDDIWYLRIADKTIAIYDDEKLLGTFTGSLTQLQKQLDSNKWVRVHRSYIVNIQYIRKIGREEVFLGETIEIPIGIRYYELLLKAVTKWAGEKKS